MLVIVIDLPVLIELLMFLTFIAINDCTDMNNEHTFTELDDFAEIQTMAISEQNFVIENITESSEVADEIEVSYNTIEEKDEEDMKECDDKIEDFE